MAILTSWRDTTRALLLNRPVWLEFKLISEETGLPLCWLKDFATGRTQEPGVNRVETLKNYLDKRLKV